MEFPLPGKKDYVKLHRQIYYKLGPPAATELKNAHEETELWQGRAEELRATHPQFINTDKDRSQRELAERFTQMRPKND